MKGHAANFFSNAPASIRLRAQALIIIAPTAGAGAAPPADGGCHAGPRGGADLARIAHRFHQMRSTGRRPAIDWGRRLHFLAGDGGGDRARVVIARLGKPTYTCCWVLTTKARLLAAPGWIGGRVRSRHTMRVAVLVFILIHMPGVDSA